MQRTLARLTLLRTSSCTIAPRRSTPFLTTAGCLYQGSLSSYLSKSDFESTSGQGQVLPPLTNQMNSFNPPRTLAETLEVVRIPPTGRNVGPRVEHIEVTADGQLSDVIGTALQVPTWFVLELLRFGAVHYSPIMPAPAAAARPFMAPEHLKRVEQLIAEGRAKLGRNPKLQHPKRVLEDQSVGSGGYVRVHVHPKRFPAAHSVDWKQQIIADMPEYVVVNKPAGVQVPPTVDNILESLVCCTARALGLPQPHTALLNTHRLDAGTSGVVVLAKNSSFANWFSKLLKDKPDNVVKVYKCLTSKPPPVGPMVHYAIVKNRAPGEPAHTLMRRPAAVGAPAANSEGLTGQDSCSNGGSSGSSNSASTGDEGVEAGAYCELIVVQVDEVQLTGPAASEWGDRAYESTLQLVTGRTHQIRAQMAAEGCPLLGDHLYQALATMWQQEQEPQQPQHEQHGQAGYQLGQCLDQQPQEPRLTANELTAQGASGADGNQETEQQAPKDSFAGAEWSRVYQEDPLKPIGLQAHILRIRDVDGRMTADAEQPEQQQNQQQQQQQQQQQHHQHHQQLGAQPKQHVATTQAHSCTGAHREQPAQQNESIARPDGQQRKKLTLTSKDGSRSVCVDDRWVEFSAGVPWWRS